MKRLIQSIKPKGFGVIIRIVAKGKRVAELDSDSPICLVNGKAFTKVTKASPRKNIREFTEFLQFYDILNDSFNRIIVDSDELFNETSNYLQTIAPDKKEILKLYTGTKPFLNILL